MSKTITKAQAYSLSFKITVNTEALHRMWHKADWDEKYGEVLGEVKMRELEVDVISKGKFGLIIAGPWKGYKVKITGYRGQVLPRTTQYVYECRSFNMNDIPNFNKIELAVPIEDVVPYTMANKLLYGN